MSRRITISGLSLGVTFVIFSGAMFMAAIEYEIQVKRFKRGLNP